MGLREGSSVTNREVQRKVWQVHCIAIGRCQIVSQLLSSAVLSVFDMIDR